MMVWFETILVVLTALTGAIWLLDKLFLAKRRAAASGVLEEAKEPVVVDYAKAFFPILALVLGLRSFVGEPFRIPSSSMMPTLLIGDFILVNKFAYGLRWPITNKKFLANGEPQRGDVVVFRPPHHPREDWIKRVIGLPGDNIGYHDGKLTVNGREIPYRSEGAYQGTGSSSYGRGPQGSVRLKIKPREGQVYVDGFFVGTVDDFDGTFQKLNIDAGGHRIEIKAPGHETISFEVLITPNETVTYKGELPQIQ